MALLNYALCSVQTAGSEKTEEAKTMSTDKNSMNRPRTVKNKSRMQYTLRLLIALLKVVQATSREHMLFLVIVLAEVIMILIFK